jgi:hypothetical protein
MSLPMRLKEILSTSWMRFGLCCALALLATLAAPSSRAIAAEWTLRHLAPVPVSEGETTEVPLSSISCPTESLCVTAGALDTLAFSQAPTGGTANWHVVHPTYDEPKQGCLERGESVAFCSSPRGSLNGVSCAGESLCVAVGYEGSVFVSTDPTGGASAWSVGEVNEGHGATHLTAVSCASPSLCVAVSGGSNNSNGGKILTSTSPASGNWQVADLGSSLDFRGVSCGTPSLCVAVARGGQMFVSTNPTGGASAWLPAGTPGGPGDLEGVSCVSTLLCAVGNMTGNILTSTELAGGGAGWAEANAGGSVQITGVSCPAASACAAVDNNGDVLTSADPTGGPAAWHFENLVPFTGEVEPRNALWSASCASTSLCALVGIQGRIFTSTDPFAVSASPPTHKGRAAPRRPKTILLFAEHFWKFTRSRHHRIRAHFHFYSPTRTRGFECKRDRGSYRPCHSPLRYRVGRGRHVLRVRAIGPTGLRGPAAIKHFRITRPRAPAS